MKPIEKTIIKVAACILAAFIIYRVGYFIGFVQGAKFGIDSVMEQLEAQAKPK